MTTLNKGTTRLRLRHPKGASTLNLDLSTASVHDLQQQIHASTGIQPSQQDLKSGYPPKSLTLIPDQLASSLGINSGDQIIVTQKAEATSQPSGSAPTFTSAAPLAPQYDPPVRQTFGSSRGGEDYVVTDAGVLVHRVVPDDNSCLFTSIGLIFEQNMYKSQKIRRVVADAIRKDPETWNDAILGRSRESYIEYILKPSSWGGAIELSILATHYNSEIASIDVETGRIDQFAPFSTSPTPATPTSRGVLIYSGIHYDAVSLAPMPDAPSDFHQTVFPIEGRDAKTDTVLNAASLLVDKLRARHSYTNTATFDLRCEICKVGLKGQKGDCILSNINEAHTIESAPPDLRQHEAKTMKRTNPSVERLSSAKASQSKKTRFVSPEEDPARFGEDVDAQLEESKNQTRKRKVKTEGYDSDSSDDGEGVVLSRRKDAENDDDDDMFAMAEKEAQPEESTGKKKKTEYLRLGDIEGQEFNEGDDGSGQDEGEGEGSESESEPEDEDDAERKAKAGMGYELSSFNMREEMEEGKFTEDGTFVRTFDPHVIHDRWLEGADEREMKKARRAKRAQEKAEREKLKAEAQEMQQMGGKEEMEKELLSFLKRGESVLEALARLGEKNKKAKAKEKVAKHSKGRKNQMDLDNGETKAYPENGAKSTQKSKIEQLTSLASNLMSLGDVDIYNKTYEHILRSIRSMGNVEPDWAPPAVTYEYKWNTPEADATATSDAQLFGPFSETEMRAWFDANYFGDSGEKISVRVSGGEWGEWSEVID